MSALNDSDLTLFHKLRVLRNDLAHEFPRFEHFGRPLEINESLAELLTLLSKLESWWFWDYENTLKPPDEQAVPGDEVYSGSELLVRLIVDMATGQDDFAQAMRSATKTGLA